MIKKMMFGISISTTIFLNAGLNYEYSPFVSGASATQEDTNNANDTSLPLAVDTNTKILSVDDLPVDKDAQNEYEPYLDGIALENRLKGDIDGDGKDDTVAWEEFANDDMGHYYQLLVIGSDGTLIWKGPKDKNIDNNTVFGSWDIGVSLPQALVDIDGDCKAEILAPAPTSDVSPQYFRILKYDSGMMVALKPKILMVSNSNNKKFVWIKDYKGNALNTGWIMNLYPTNSIHMAKADIVYMDKQGNATFKKALLEFNPHGATVKKWLKADTPQEVMVGSAPMPSKTFKPISNTKIKATNTTNNSKKTDNKSAYRAYISAKDHKDILGNRIKTLRGVLIRDRENYYSGAKDSQDTGNGMFKSRNSRNMMKSMQIIPENTTYGHLKQSILYGHGLIRVSKDNGVLRVKLLK